MQTLFRFVLAMGLLALAGPHVAHAQAAAEQPQSSAAETNEKEPTEEQKELDAQLLGSWSVLTKDLNTELTDAVFEAAIKACETFPDITQLDVQPGIETALPDRKSVRGEVVYFRTDQGLQRFELGTNRVHLLPNLEKAVNTGGRTIWRASSRFAKFDIGFSNPVPGSDALLMIEEDSLYLKCADLPGGER
ncbi:MAG: hypothetical protein OXR62_08685 [Ahrensia sp.]|nr:hypothetical protein [Ahrensia sp.]